MNIFRILASGRFPLREEVVSAFVAYLLAPRMDHGLGSTMLTTLLRAINRELHIAELDRAAQQLDQRLRDNLFGDAAQPAVELELPYPVGNSTGFIDIVVRCSGWFIAIENKILLSSTTPGQLRAQYQGLRQVLAQRGLSDQRVLMIYLVPAVRSADGWSLSASCQEELIFDRSAGDQAIMMTWQPTNEGMLSFIELIRSILAREGRGEIAPLGSEIRHTLLALIDFALGEFQGYPYDHAVANTQSDQRRVADLLTTTEQLFVGVRNGMAGVISLGWRNPSFADRMVSISESPRGWQYLPVAEFQVIARWAMDPDNTSLEGIQWSGKPFFTAPLYLVAKHAGEKLFIGIRGGLEALNRMSSDELRLRRTWELSTHPRSSQWFSGTTFCATLESKGVTFDQPDSLGESE